MSNHGAYWGGVLLGFVLVAALAIGLATQVGPPTDTAAARIAAGQTAATADPQSTDDSETVANDQVQEPEAVIAAEPETPAVAEEDAVGAAPEVETAEAPAQPTGSNENVELAASPDVRPEPSVEPVVPPSPIPSPATLDDNADEETEIALATPTPESEPTPQATPEPAIAPEPVDEPEEQSSAPVLGPNDLPPYKAYANIYRGDASQPLLAIVLTGIGVEDSAGQEEVIDELLLMPGPLAIVISPDADDPPNVALDIRDAGFEALMGLNADSFKGSAPADAASQIMQRAGEVIGVAVLGADLDDSNIATGLVDAAALNGMAVLDTTRDGGSVSYRLASAKDLPAAPSGRRFDETPSSAMVFQSLERAAFDARRTGAFVVVAEATPAVMTGLRRWMNVKANKTVTVAPLSAVIEKMVRQ
ncbi:MAG: divergent polysaccharide deacetylase family protein [Pseudomonadota bacterium]